MPKVGQMYRIAEFLGENAGTLVIVTKVWNKPIFYSDCAKSVEIATMVAFQYIQGPSLGKEFSRSLSIFRRITEPVH